MRFVVILLLALCLLINPRFAIGQGVSMTTYSGYESQPTCVQNCVWHVGVDDDLVVFIGCSPPWQNSCYCQTASASSASSFLSSCVTKACSSGPPEGSIAVAIYTSYCAIARAQGSSPESSTTSILVQTLSASDSGSGGVPALIVVPVTTGPPTAPTPHSSIPTYSDTGPLLRGYCTTAEYVLLDGPTAFWAPAVGCVGDKTDCCPYSVTSTAKVATITVVSTSTVTVSVDPNGQNSPFAGVQAYPTPASSDLATLAHCPDDYVTVSGGCCPSGFQLWNALIGGSIPCYSSLSSTMVPPALPVTTSEPLYAPSFSTPVPSATASQKPTSAIVNIVYAVQFTLQPSSGLSTGAKAGIGVGAGAAGVVILLLAGLLIWRTKKQKKAEERLNAVPQTSAPDTNSNGQDTSATAVSPYAYSTQTDFPTNGAAQSQMHTPGGYVPPEQHGYFPPPQMQQSQPIEYYGQSPMQPVSQAQHFAPPQGDYGHQQMTQMPQSQHQDNYGQQPAPGQSAVHYSPVASTVSPLGTDSAI